jgi:hypothetical protein
MSEAGVVNQFRSFRIHRVPHNPSIDPPYSLLSRGILHALLSRDKRAAAALRQRGAGPGSADREPIQSNFRNGHWLLASATSRLRQLPTNWELHPPMCISSWERAKRLPPKTRVRTVMTKSSAMTGLRWALATLITSSWVFDPQESLELRVLPGMPVGLLESHNKQ